MPSRVIDRTERVPGTRGAGTRPATGAALLAALLCSGVVVWAHDTGGDSHSGAETDIAGETIDIVPATGEPPVLVLAQGRAYRVLVHVREPVELHLHGYDLTARAAPGAPSLFGFVAEHTGRFPIEAHRDGDLLGRDSRPVAFIEVRREPGK